MRTAEWMTAACLMALSVWFMIHATVLPIGWVEGSGPGGGAFPFWLSVVMFGCAAAIFVREFRGWRALGNGGAFLLQHSWRRLILVCAALAVTVAAIHVVGTYVAVPLFMLFYMRVLGDHRWMITIILTVATPIVLFFFFEVALKILLPKGQTEPLFYPLYAIFL
ncbi:MAG: tripartite tricarboxylate transporter TctB family protein [Pseudomonadota bacterium]